MCLAEDEATGHGVAVRFLPRGLACPSSAAQQVQPMGRSIVAASTADPALVRVLELGEAENGQAFVAMELVEGRRLSEILQEGPLTVAAALHLALDLGAAVETLHTTGLVHGALRPRNVMVLEDGRVKLMDVELNGLRDAGATKGIIPAEPPPEYLSPEQILGDPVTEKTDVYAFAVMLYEMLCGVPPFQAETRGPVLAKHLTETAAPLRRRRPAVPESVESIIALALDKQPDLRPLMEIVLNCLWTNAKSPATRWKRIAVIAGGAVLAASLAVLVVWDLVAPRPSGPPPLAQPAPPADEQAPGGTPPTSSAHSLETLTPSTLGTTGPCSWVGCHDVQVCPGGRRRHEFGEVQGSDDRPCECALRDVVEIGALAVDEFPIRPPNRHAPERVSDRRACSQQFVGNCVIVTEQRLELGSKGNARGTGERGAIHQEIGLLAVGLRQRVAKD